MSSLTVYHQANPAVPNKVLTHAEDIAATLAELGVRFERYPAAVALQPGMHRDEVCSVLHAQLAATMSERGHVAVDVLSESRAQTYQDEALAESLVELRCTGPEEHWLIAGRGLLSLHIEEYVYAVLCEQHDLLSIPAGTRHWFDKGGFPHLLALRMHGGQENSATGDDIAARFPRLEDC